MAYVLRGFLVKCACCGCLVVVPVIRFLFLPDYQVDKFARLLRFFVFCLLVCFLCCFCLSGCLRFVAYVCYLLLVYAFHNLFCLLWFPLSLNDCPCFVFCCCSEFVYCFCVVCFVHSFL